LGLLLERPMFNSYNKRAKHDLGREPIDFDKFRKDMDEFKQREIYERMYRDEEKDNM
jgi:tRNA pseudouridine38-40 synthase